MNNCFERSYLLYAIVQGWEDAPLRAQKYCKSSCTEKNPQGLEFDLHLRIKHNFGKPLETKRTQK